MAEPAHDAERSYPLREVLEKLVADGKLEPDRLSTIARDLGEEAATPHTPWYIQALLGLSGWVAAIFFILFLALAGLLDDEAAPLLFWGVSLTGAGVGIRLKARGVFLHQLSLAFNIAGKTLILGGAHELVDAFWSVPLASMLLLTITYPVSRDPVDRFVTTLGTLTLTTGWIISEEAVHVLLHGLLLLEMLGTGYLFMRHHSRALSPLGYALALGMLATLVLPLTIPESLNTPWWPSRLVLMAGLVPLYGWAAGDLAHLRREPLAVALITTLLLGVVSTPGVLAAIGLLVLGHARDDRILLGMALAFLPAFIVLFYYNLNLDLATKSYALMASGMILLVARWYLGRRPWAKEME